MLTAYAVKIEYNENGSIKRIYSPDLDFILLDNNIYNEEGDNIKKLGIYKYLQGKILARIQELNDDNYIIYPPRKLKEYIKDSNDSLISWMPVFIIYNYQIGVFEKNLPRLGIFTRVFTAIGGAVGGILSLAITFADNDSENSSKGWSLAIIGGLCMFVINLLIFGYSKTLTHGAWVGRKMDNYYSKCFNKGKRVYDPSFHEHETIVNLNPPSNATSLLSSTYSILNKLKTLDKTDYAKIASFTGYYLLATGDVITSSALTYQTTTLLGNRALKKLNNVEMERLFVFALALFMMSVHCITYIFLDFSFATSAAQDLSQKILSLACFSQDPKYVESNITRVPLLISDDPTHNAQDERELNLDEDQPRRINLS